MPTQLNKNQMTWDDLFELTTEDTSKYLWAISEWEDPEDDYSQEFLFTTALSCRNRSRIGIGLMNGSMPSEYAPYREKLLKLRAEAETILNGQATASDIQKMLEAIAALTFNDMQELLDDVRRICNDGMFFNNMDMVKENLYRTCHQFQIMFSDAAHAYDELSTEPLSKINSEAFRVRFKEVETLFKNRFGYFKVLENIWDNIRAEEYCQDNWWTQLPVQQIEPEAFSDSVFAGMQTVYQQSLLRSTDQDCPMTEKVCAYALRELEPSQNREVREHVLTCGSCFEMMMDISAAEAEAGEHEGIVDVLPKVYEAIKEQDPHKPWEGINPAFADRINQTVPLQAPWSKLPPWIFDAPAMTRFPLEKRYMKEPKESGQQEHIDIPLYSEIQGRRSESAVMIEGSETALYKVIKSGTAYCKILVPDKEGKWEISDRKPEIIGSQIHIADSAHSTLAMIASSLGLMDLNKNAKTVVEALNGNEDAAKKLAAMKTMSILKISVIG